MKKLCKNLSFVPVITVLLLSFGICILSCEEAISIDVPVADSRNITDKNQDERELDNTVDGSIFNDPYGRLVFDGMQFFADIEEYDYWELMTLDELMRIYEWLETLKFDLEDINDKEWVDKNFNKIIKKAIAVGILRDIFYHSPLVRWSTGTHSLMMTKVFDLLGDSDPVRQYFSNINVLVDLYNYSRQPDKDENIKGTHYYVVYNKTPTATGDYYPNNNGNISRSARTRVEDHYSTALNAWANGDKLNAVKYLGFAVHYLMDIGNTLHSTGITGIPHRTYEKYIDDRVFDKLVDKYNDFHSTPTKIKSRYNIFRNDLGTGINYLATSSAYGSFVLNNFFPIVISFYDAVKTARTDKDVAGAFYDPVIIKTLPLTEEFVAALLEQFYTDTRAIDGIIPPTHRSNAVIKKDTPYYLKNAASNKYLDVKDWKAADASVVQQYTFTGAQNQIVFARWNSQDASFWFEPAHVTSPKMRLSFSSNNAILRPASNSSFYQRFKPTYLGGMGYRIMTGIIDGAPSSPEYAYVLRVHPNYPKDNSLGANGQYITNFKYNPNSKNHYWYFEEVKDYHKIWMQPIWTSNSNPQHGTITASSMSTNRHPYGAFDGFIGSVPIGIWERFPAVQWTSSNLAQTGWIQLKLNYEICVHKIEHYQHDASDSNWTKDAYFTGKNNIRLGNAFIGPKSNYGRTIIDVGGVITDTVRLNITSSHGSYMGTNEIKIFATLP
jgi:hypothetical protein